MFGRFSEGIKAGFLGQRGNSVPRATVSPGRLIRPEGERSYLLACPGQASIGMLPLVVALHGAGASARQLFGLAFPPSPFSVWLEIADREKLLVVAADAGKGGWSDCFASAERVARKDDVAFVAALIDHMVAEHNADPDRVFVMGVSRGGHMAYRIATEIPHKLAAFSAVLAGMPPAALDRRSTAPLSALIFGCTADPLIPYQGGKSWRTLGLMEPAAGIEETAHFWRDLAQLPAAPVQAEVAHRHAWDKTRVNHYVWGDAPDQLQVGLYRIANGGHAEPSGTQRYPVWINRLVGPQNADIEVAEAAWKFFKDKRNRHRSATKGRPGEILTGGCNSC